MTNEQGFGEHLRARTSDGIAGRDGDSYPMPEPRWTATWFDEAFTNPVTREPYPVPADIRTAAERVVSAYGIRGICDPMWIANVIARETGRGDGLGSFGISPAPPAAGEVREGGNWENLDQLIADCTTLGSHYFRPSSMSRFDSVLDHSRLWGGQWFVIGDKGYSGDREWGVGWALADGDVSYLPAPTKSSRAVWRSEFKEAAARLCSHLANPNGPLGGLVQLHPSKERCHPCEGAGRHAPAFYRLKELSLCSNCLGDRLDYVVHGLDHGSRVRGIDQ